MGESPIRALAVDDHPLMRQGIAAVIAAEAGMLLVGEAEDGFDAIEQCRKYSPDIVLMDVRMPRLDGIQAAAILCAEIPNIRIMVLTAHTGDMQARLAIKQGQVDICSKAPSGKIWSGPSGN